MADSPSGSAHEVGRRTSGPVARFVGDPVIPALAGVVAGCAVAYFYRRRHTTGGLYERPPQRRSSYIRGGLLIAALTVVALASRQWFLAIPGGAFAIYLLVVGIRMNSSDS